MASVSTPAPLTGKAKGGTQVTPWSSRKTAAAPVKSASSGGVNANSPEALLATAIDSLSTVSLASTDDGKVDEVIIQWWTALDDGQKAELKDALYWSGMYDKPDEAERYIGSRLLSEHDVAALRKTISVAKWNKVDPMKMLQSQAEGGRRVGIPIGQEAATADQIAGMKKLQLESEQQLRAFAADNALDLPDQWYGQTVNQVLTGETDVDSVMQSLRRDYVVNMFPAWQKQIEGGQSVSQIASPYMSTVANVLERPADLNDPTVRAALQYTVNGQPAVKPLWEFETELRNDPRYEYTGQAKNQMGGVARMLAQKFGLQ